MRILHLSDIHGDLKDLYNACKETFDVAVFTGDMLPELFMGRGKVEHSIGFERVAQDSFVKNNLSSIIKALANRPLVHVSGNHDAIPFPEWASKETYCLDDGSGVVINGIRFWGFAGVPGFSGMWNWELDKDILIDRVNSMPNNTDVVITHTPPWGILDLAYGGYRCGITDIADKISSCGAKAHLFGHIHESCGLEIINGIKFSNAYRGDYRIIEV